MAVRFIIDSASDVLPEECARFGVRHLPMTVLFGTEEFADSVDLSHKAFFERLAASDQLPTTCQIPPSVFAAAMEQVVAAGDEAVVITMSSKLSGTYQSACIAASEHSGRVFVVDSLSVSLGERILLQQGLALSAQGLSAKQIAQTLDEEKKKIRLFALLDTLEYLKKGGRISAATALAGSLLSIKPVVAVEDGAVAMVGKARGSKQGNSLLRGLVRDHGGIQFQKPFCLAYSGLSDAQLAKYIADSPELLQCEPQIASVGCTIGTHVGPGVIAVAFFEN